MWTSRKHVTRPCGISVRVNRVLSFSVAADVYSSFTGFWATVMYPTCVSAVVVYDLSPVLVCVKLKKAQHFAERHLKRALSHRYVPHICATMLFSTSSLISVLNLRPSSLRPLICVRFRSVIKPHTSTLKRCCILLTLRAF